MFTGLSGKKDFSTKTLCFGGFLRAIRANLRANSANTDHCSRFHVPDLPPSFSHKATDPITIERSRDLHMS